MKKNSGPKSGFVTSRNLASLLLCTFGIFLTGLAATQSHQAAALQNATAAKTLTHFCRASGNRPISWKRNP